MTQLGLKEKTMKKEKSFTITVAQLEMIVTLVMKLTIEKMQDGNLQINKTGA